MNRLIGILYVTAAVFSWGVYLPYAKLILQKLSPPVFLSFRLLIGAIILFGFSTALKKSFRFERKDLLWVVTAGLIGIVLHQTLQLESLKHTSATNVGWILTLIPSVTGVMAWIFLKERISLHQIIGLVIALTGLLFFISNGDIRKLSFIRNYGDFLSLISVFTWSSYSIITKHTLGRYDALPISTIHMALGFLFFSILSINSMSAELSNLNLQDWVIIILTGLIPSGLAYFWWNAGLNRLSAMNTSMFLFPEAIFASLAGYIVLNEVFTTKMLLFSFIVAAGVFISVKER